MAFDAVAFCVNRVEFSVSRSDARGTLPPLGSTTVPLLIAEIYWARPACRRAKQKSTFPDTLTRGFMLYKNFVSVKENLTLKNTYITLKLEQRINARNVPNAAAWIDVLLPIGTRPTNRKGRGSFAMRDLQQRELFVLMPSSA